MEFLVGLDFSAVGRELRSLPYTWETGTQKKEQNKYRGLYIPKFGLGAPEMAVLTANCEWLHSPTVNPELPWTAWTEQNPQQL